MSTPKFYTAKELVAKFAERNIVIGRNTSQAIVRECPSSIRGRYVEFEAAWVFWSNPAWRPGRKLTQSEGTIEKW